MLSWERIDGLYVCDPIGHWEAARREGLDCPFDVFVQVFHEQYGARAVPTALAAVDWRAVAWGLESFSGMQLRQVYVDRCYEHAIEEARTLVRLNGIYDDRPAVMSAWEHQRTWMVPPVLVATEIALREQRYDLLVGYTRLGNLLGLLDRGEMPEYQRHWLWVGRSTEPFDVGPNFLAFRGS